MTRGILIAGFESPTALALEREAAQRVQRLAAALVPNHLPSVVRREDKAAPQVAPQTTSRTEQTGTSRIPLTWAPGSPLSARTLLVSAENRLDRIDEALLVCTPPSLRSRPKDVDLAAIQTLVDDHIKGWYYLLRELTRYFTQQGTGTLALVLALSDLEGNSGTQSETADPPDILGPVVAASFRALMQALLASSTTSSYRAIGFMNTDPTDEAGFAAFVMKTIDEASKRDQGKLYRYGKLSLFK